MSEQHKYLLKGDISGIQDFIFNVSSKGAAKTLKARSYMVQVISYLAYQKALQSLPDAKPFYDGGGSFFVLFQTESEETAGQLVDKLKEEIDTALLQHELSIGVGCVPLNNGFGKAWKELRKVANYEKLRMYQHMSEVFEPFDKQKYDTSLNEESGSQEVRNKLKELGNDLLEGNPLYKAIANELVKYESFTHTLFGQNLQQTKTDFDGRLVNKLPFWSNYSEIQTYNQYRFNNKEKYPDNFDLNNDDIIDFDAFGDFAAHRTGTNKIAILKLDVDNLGQKFGNQEGEDKAKQLSQSFSDFFDRELYTIYKNDCFCLSGQPEKFEANIYPIFAGGDDCFIIGAWDAVLCFAETLQRIFEDNFKGEHTVSSGIVIISPTLPVKSFSEMAEDALVKAKSDGKNKISFFDLCFSWEDYRYILKFSRELRQLMEEQDINRSYLDKIRKSAKGFNALQNTDGADFNKIYKLKYYISRQNKKLSGLVELLFEPYYESLKDKLLNNEKQSPYDTAVYPVASRITELLTRKKLDYEKRPK